MNIKPFNTLILVEKIVEQKKIGDIILSDGKDGFFVKYKVIAVGDLVAKIKPNTIVIGYDLMEKVDNKIGFITQDKIFGEVIE